MVNATLPNHRLLMITSGLAYIATGMLSALPAASLILLASNTHVSLEVAGSMFTLSAFGELFSVVLGGLLIGYIKPRISARAGHVLCGFRLHYAISDQFISRVTDRPDAERSGVRLP